MSLQVSLSSAECRQETYVFTFLSLRFIWSKGARYENPVNKTHLVRIVQDILLVPSSACVSSN
jgi:hypothetical protein